MNKSLALAGLLTAALAGGVSAQSPLQTVHDFYGPMPTGVTVSHTGRVFVCYPHWGDPVSFTVGEIRNGREVPYPDARINRLDKAHPRQCLYSVQSVVVDPRDRLWALDTGSVKLGRNVPGGPKLVGIDLTSNKVFRTILIPRPVAGPYTYLNDVRFDLRRGKAGMAYITDSGQGGIIVVDLASGTSWHRLQHDPSSHADPGFRAIVNGQPLLQRLPGNKPKLPTFNSDGIAISADGKTLYYCPISTRHLYCVSTDALADRAMTDGQVAAKVRDLGVKPVADGLESDAVGDVYVTDEEHHRIARRAPSGTYTVLVTDPRPYDWMDTMAVAANGYLYFTANQLEQQGSYHYGRDLRRKPYKLFRVKISQKPVLLK